MNMKRLFLLLCVNVIFTLCVYAGQAKYVFYFIGDGMGLAEVIGTQYMLHQCQTGGVGITPLCFAQFPYTGFAINNSYNSDVTDSSAAGTALATGHKTNNGVLGMLPDRVTPVNSIATWAKAAQRSVGIATSVTVNNATPAAFYSHSASRNDYYNIGKQLAATDFEFFGGSDFQKGYPKDKPSLVELAEKGGFTVVRGKKAYEEAKKDAEKIVMLFDYRTTDGDFPYAIDAKPGELTLAEMTESAVDFLMKKNNGFFLMVEGGKIDHAGHSNDAAACLKDVVAMDDAVKIAFEFYKKHKEETLIVVTADHETGGLSLSGGRYELHTDLLANQKLSKHGFSEYLNKLRHEKNDSVTWEDVRKALEENFGFWGNVQISDDEEKALYNEWYHSFVENKEVKMVESWYYRDEPLSDMAVRIINKHAQMGWAVSSHSGIAVPVYAIGVGAERFTGQYDNTDIPKKIAESAGYKVK